MSLLSDYFEDKYTDDHPDDERFKKEPGEYHASQVSNCHRYWYWDFTRAGEDSWSPYFELGRMFEDMYGRALRWKYGEDRVQQDVGFEMRLSNDVTLVGESDWVIVDEDAEPIDRVIIDQDGHREFVRRDPKVNLRNRLDALRQDVNSLGRVSGNINNVVDDLKDYLGDPREETYDYDGQIEKVIETKTTKKIEWRQKYGHKRKHQYQLASYMWAFDAPGEIVYVTRNEADQIVFEFERDVKVETDIEIRTLTQHRNLMNGTVPGTNPMTENQCQYCEFRDECQDLGGSRWK